MHAARRKAIRELRLDDVDLGNRRPAIGGRTRPIDELTRQVLVEWLSYRNTRWPCTANPHLLINQMSANGTGPVSTIYFAKTALRGQAATLERLRVQPAAPGSPRPRAGPLAPGRDVWPRPQDRNPIRGERQDAPGDRSRAARPRLMPARPPSDGPEPCLQTDGVSRPVAPSPPGRQRVTRLRRAA